MNTHRIGILVSTILTLLVGSCRSEITVAIEFMSFKNPRGRDQDGALCDPRLFGSSPCDYFFEICIDRIRPSEPHTDHWIANCDIELVRTGAYHDTNDIEDFGRDMRGVSNPILVHRDDEQRGDGIAVRVRVMDYDDAPRGDHDNVDLLKFDYIIESHKVTQFWERHVSEPHTAVLNGRRDSEATSMTIAFQTYCTEHYFKDVYGHCSIFCKESRDYHTGYYTCTEKGEKVCVEGWLDPESHCKVAVKNCVTNECYNGGMCIGGLSRFQCNCTYGFTGEDCSICKPGAICQQVNTAPLAGGDGGGSNNALVIGLVIGLLLLIIIIILIIALLLRERRKRRMKEQSTGTAAISTTTMGQQTPHTLTTDTGTGGPLYDNALDSSSAQTDNARNALAARATQTGASGGAHSNDHVRASSGAKALEAGLLASPPPYKAVEDGGDSASFHNPTYDNPTGRSSDNQDNLYDEAVSVKLHRKY